MVVVLPDGAVVSSMSNRPTDDALQAAEIRSLLATIKSSSNRLNSDLALFMALGNFEGGGGNGYLIFTKAESKVLFDCQLCQDSTRKRDTTHGGSWQLPPPVQHGPRVEVAARKGPPRERDQGAPSAPAVCLQPSEAQGYCPRPGRGHHACPRPWRPWPWPWCLAADAAGAAQLWRSGGRGRG